MADRIKGITVEIGGDTTGLSKALSGVNKNIGDTQKQLKDVERLLKLDPGNTELLRQKYELLNQEVEQTDVKLKALKDAEKQVQAQFQRGDIGKDKYDALKREVIETEAKLGNLRSEAAKAKNTVNGIDENPIEEVARAADDAEESLQDAGKEASNFGDYLKAGAIVEGAKGIASSLKDAAESSKEYMKIMGSLEISSQKAGYSAEETAAAYNTLYGVLGDNQTAATTTANLQALGLAQRQLEQLINGTIGAWATYGDSIPIDGLAEAINETVQTGKVTGTFADVLNWAGTSEDEFNKKLEEANSAAERANLVLNELSRQGLMNAGKAWQDNNEVLVESNKANAEYEDSMAQLSETVLPIITKITEAVTKFINFILDNRASVVAALTAIAAGFAAFKITSLISSLISGFTTFFGVIKSGQGVMAALNAVMSANPIGLIITAVAALVAAFIYLWNNCEEFRQFWIDLWENIKKVFSDVWNAIVGFFTETIPNAIGKVTEIFQKFDNWLTGIFSADWSESFGAFGEIINGFFANVKNIWNSIKKVFQGIIDFVSGVFSGDWSKAWEGIKSIFSGIWDGFVSIVKMPINGIIGLINAMIDGINWVIEKINTISFDVPDWIPFVGGQTWGFNLPTIGKIPYLAKGGILSQGSAVVGEAGPELLTMAGGRAVVQPLTNQNTNTTNFGGVNFYVYGAPGHEAFCQVLF